MSDFRTPAGWMLVPIKPTQKMVNAAKAIDGRLSVWKWADGYAAMLKAAPKAPEPKQDECEPVYQYQLADGKWVDRSKRDYEADVAWGQATVRVLYTAPPKRDPLSREKVRHLMSVAGYVDATQQEKADFINGVRFAEREHGIGGQS